jgi:hypothetical protein
VLATISFIISVIPSSIPDEIYILVTSLSPLLVPEIVKPDSGVEEKITKGNPSGTKKRQGH